MPTRQYRTLGELRAEMRAKLGAASAGAAAGPNSTLIDAHLRDAQTVLYWTHDWAHLRHRWTDTLGMNETLLDYPSVDSAGVTYSCNPDRVKWVSVYRGGVWSPPIQKGITASMYTYETNYSWPQRWEPMLQMQFWPSTDQEYPVAIFGIADLQRFTQDTDRASIDDTLIGIVATATLKAHYRQPDAAGAEKIADALLIKLKSKSWGQSVFRPSDWIDTEPLVRPQTV
jgi:hypothetical protein